MTAITTRKFPTETTIEINIEDEAVKKDKCVGGVMFSHGSIPSIRDIFCSPPIDRFGQFVGPYFSGQTRGADNPKHSCIFKTRVSNIL